MVLTAAYLIVCILQSNLNLLSSDCLTLITLVRVPAKCQDTKTLAKKKREAGFSVAPSASIDQPLSEGIGI